MTIEHIDLMVDEFKRIAACTGATPEIIGLCERAITNTVQKVPVIEQRDKLQRDLGRAGAENLSLRAQLEKAQAIADDAAISLVKSHSHIADNGWLCIEDEPVDEDVAYLVARGLLEQDKGAPMFVRFTKPHGGFSDSKGDKQ